MELGHLSDPRHEWRIPQPKVELNVKSQNRVVNETGIKTCLGHDFLLLKSRILPEKKKPVGVATQNFPAVTTRQQGAPLLHHKKYFEVFFDGKVQQNCGL